MGTSFDFTCRECGYRAEVSGGVDVGREVATATIACRDCRRLFDVEIAGNPWEAATFEIKPEELRCPRRRGYTVALWCAGDPCPRCGESLPEGEPVAIWD